MPALRRRFCLRGTWQFAANGVRFTGASAVRVTRYRYRGQQHTGPVGTPAGPGSQLTPAGKTRGAPGAVRVARRVRRAGRGNPPGAILAGRPGPTQLILGRAGAGCAMGLPLFLPLTQVRGLSSTSGHGAGERDRTADPPFTSSTASRAECASCNDGRDNCADGTRCAGIIPCVVPRTVPRGRRKSQRP